MSDGGERKWRVKLTGVKGVKLVMCIDTCQVMNGWFGARAATTLFVFFWGGGLLEISPISFSFLFFFKSGGYKICLKEEMQIKDVKDSHPKLRVMGTMMVRVLEQAELGFLHVQCILNHLRVSRINLLGCPQMPRRRIHHKNEKQTKLNHYQTITKQKINNYQATIKTKT
jgi:hypothetical protein